MTRLVTAALLLLAACPATFAKTPPAAPPHWVGTWATADVERPTTKDAVAADMTLRQIVHVSLGGPLVRIELSNQFGTEPLLIGAVHIALEGTADQIDLATANALTFSGRDTVSIPPGATILSDPVKLALPPFANLAISIFLPAQTLAHLTVHNSAYQTNYTSAGNEVGAKALTTPKKVYSWFFLKAVDVQVSADSAAVVAFGDSITDGTASTTDSNGRWPDVLARKLQANNATANLSVLNVGIGGNRVLHDNTGLSALARFDTDVLAQSGVKYLILLESINDIGHAYDPAKPYDVVTGEDLIAGLTQLVERATSMASRSSAQR